MSKQKIDISDFSLFCDVIKSAAKIVESAKITIGPGGLEIYGVRSNIARCELVSNAVSAAETVEFSVKELNVFLRILNSAKDAHDGDFSDLAFSYDKPFVKFESKKFKTKYATCNESIISGWVSKKIEAELVPVFEFTASTDAIKKINGHSFMFSDPKSIRLYLETRDDMENNTVFGSLGNREMSYSNEITLKFGLATFGSLDITDKNGDFAGRRQIILDLERVNLFSAVPTNDIKFSLMDKNCLVSRTRQTGQNGSFFDMNIYSTILKN